MILGARTSSPRDQFGQTDNNGALLWRKSSSRLKALHRVFFLRFPFDVAVFLLRARRLFYSPALDSCCRISSRLTNLTVQLFPLTCRARATLLHATPRSNSHSTGTNLLLLASCRLMHRDAQSKAGLFASRRSQCARLQGFPVSTSHDEIGALLSQPLAK